MIIVLERLREGDQESELSWAMYRNIESHYTCMHESSTYTVQFQTKIYSPSLGGSRIIHQLQRWHLLLPPSLVVRRREITLIFFIIK